MLIVFLLSFCWPFALAHYDAAYFHSSDDPFDLNEDWMSGLRDDVMISELSLPGTHDSAAFTTSDPFVGTQALNFEEQLRYGIRMFDIRYRHIGNEFALHHGFVFLNVMFDDFLDKVQEFLQAHPSETVLFRLKNEFADGDNNTRSHQDTLNDYLSQYNTYKQTSTNIPLEEARGKFIVLNDSVFHDSGIPYKESDIQDYYVLGSIWDLYRKWINIRDHLDKPKNRNTFYINYLSGSGGAFPYFVASGHISPSTSALRLSTGLNSISWPDAYPDFPRLYCIGGICNIAFEGTNTLARDYIQSNLNSKRTVGLIMADFPGASLIKEIINNNFQN